MSRANFMFFVSHEVKILSKKRSFCDFLFNISFSISNNNICEFRPFFRNRWKSLPLDILYWLNKNLQGLFPGNRTFAILSIDQFGFKNVISLRPPYLGGFQEHDKRGVFQTMSCFSSGTGVRLGHCIIFCHAFGSPPVWRPPRSWNRIGLQAMVINNVNLI